MNQKIKDVHKLLDGMKIKRAHNGYQYLSGILHLLLMNPQDFIMIHELYDKVAEQYHKNSKTIERAIRYSLKHTDMTNKEFVMMAIEKLDPNNLYTSHT